MGKAVKIFLPHLQDCLVPAVLNSWEKPGIFSLPWVAHTLPSPWLGRWEPGLLPLLAAGVLAGAASKSIRRRLVRVTHDDGPQLPSQWEKMGNAVTGEDNYSRALSELN